jgi:hypothetical protein
MAERDRFELDLAAALRAYLEEAPTEVRPTELARQFATAYPHRRAALGPWHLPTALRPAWILLLLAGLLAALVGGTLLVGSQLQRRLPAVLPPAVPTSVASFTCPPGSNPDLPGPADQARPIIGDGLAAMVFDRHAGRIVLLAQLLESVETWTFDVCRNTWTRMHPDREPGSPLGEATHTIYDIDSDATIAIDGESTWVYRLAADTWTRAAAAPVVRQWNTLTWTYDPVSGLVFAADAGELWSYDVETDTWAFVSPVPWPAGTGAITYDASVDRLVAYANRRELWLFDLRSGTWSKSGADTPEVVCGMGWPNAGIAYDEVTGRSVVSCDVTFAYDAATDRWEPLADDASPFALYDPVNKRFVGLESDSLLAFDPATQERMVLLPLREGEPTPSPR